MRGKRAQFFLLAAVIISAIIISFGAGTNRAVVSEEPDDFYASSDEARREAGAFLDYAVFRDFDGDDELEDFLGRLAESIMDTNPDTEFAFIYGEKNSMTVINYGSESIIVANKLIEGREDAYNVVCVGTVCEQVSPDDSGPVIEEVTFPARGGSFEVKIDPEDDGLSFPISDYRQVIIIMQKEKSGERYVSVG